MIADQFTPLDIECLIKTAVELWEESGDTDLSDRQQEVLDRARDAEYTEDAGQEPAAPPATTPASTGEVFASALRGHVGVPARPSLPRLPRSSAPLGTRNGGFSAERITSRHQLIELTRNLGVREDWHEPHEQNVTAAVSGAVFNSSGVWPSNEVIRRGSGTTVIAGCPVAEAIPAHTELHVLIRQDDQIVAAINLADLLAWATGHDGE